MITEDNFSYFSLKLYVVTPHLNRLDETVQMRGHNICFYAELTKIIPNTPSNLEPCNWQTFITRSPLPQPDMRPREFCVSSFVTIQISNPCTM